MARGDTAKSYGTYKTSLLEKPAFHCLIALAILATFFISIFALVNTYELKKALVPRAVNINDFLKKLTTHDEMKSHVGVAPLNIIQINNNNFANLQSQISGLDVSHIGNFIVQYTDRIVVYDYENNKIRGAVGLQQPQQAQLPADFLTKLHRHPELQGLQNQQPVGGQLDQASLTTLRQQFPDVYANAKVGDFLLRYQTKLIIYDYNQDKIVKAIDLG